MIRRLFGLLGLSDEAVGLLDRLISLVQNRGWKSATIYIKDVRLSVYRFVARSPCSKGEVSCRLTKDGLPCILSLAQREALRSGDLVIVREVLSVQRFSYLTETRFPADLSSITKESTGNFESGTYRTLSTKIVESIDHLGINIPEEAQRFKGFVVSTKMGPLGLAICSAIAEYMHPTFQVIRNNLLKWGNGLYSEILNIDDLLEDGIDLSQLPGVGHSRECATLRRLAQIDAPEGKTRIIAQADYWTQSALRPFHQYQIDHLGKWFGECDRTKNQLGFSPILPNDNRRFYSFDLSSATDRFPLILQSLVVAKLLGSKREQAWRRLLVGMAFSHQGKQVNYKCGQPMGIYSSWAVFTQTHHLLVRVAGHNVYRHYDFSNYVMLGDDIVIYDSKVAQEYARLLKVLGVEISPSKTLVSDSAYEFAKRLFVGGVDVSGLAWDQLLKVSNPLTVLAGFLADTYVRTGGDFIVSQSVVRRFVSVLHGGMKSSFSAVSAIYLQTIWILHSSGNGINQFPVPSGSCVRDGAPMLEDLVMWWGLTRLHSYLPELDRSQKALFSALEVAFKGVGPVNLTCIPSVAVLYQSAQNVGSFVVDMRLARGSVDHVTAQLLEAEDTINIGSPDFRRRQERVREQISHGTRRYHRYYRQYQLSLNETSAVV